MESLSDLIWEDEDEDVSKLYDIPLQGTLCIVLCTIVTMGGACSVPPDPFQISSQGVWYGC